jgi:hypothetical protein
MAEELKIFPPLTCRHLHLTRSQLAKLKRSLKLAAKNTKQPPRSLQDFQQQYARIHDQHLGITPR